jgi:hypothetical protein
MRPTLLLVTTRADDGPDQCNRDDAERRRFDERGDRTPRL